MKRFCLTTALTILTSGLYLSTAFAGTATVRWQANTDSDLAGYRVFYGTASRTYEPPIPVGKVTSYTFNNLTEGRTYFFALRAVDDAGNESGYSAEVSKTIPAAQPETEPPAVRITSPVDASAYSTSNATLKLGGTASDNVGVTQVSWSNSAGGSGTASGTTNWSANISLAPGQNVVTVRARDAAGNVGSDAITVAYNAPDTAAPTLTITSPTSSSAYSTNSATLAIGGTASDNEGVAQVSWSNSAGGSGTASGTTNWSANVNLAEGQNVITVTARDAAGNQTSRTLTVAYAPPVETDTVAPSISIISPTTRSSYSTRSNAVSLSGRAEDNKAVVRVTWKTSTGASGVANGSSSWSVADIPLSEHANLITVTAVDAAGNEASSSLTVYYSPPRTRWYKFWSRW